MRHDIIIFLGPSLDLATARQVLDADYRPPAGRGDLTRAVSDGARVIGLIDGVFFQECAVAHREVLAALRHGVRVVGASSMGALRAAELDAFGMEGVGKIYEAYRDWEIVADDEVALMFDPLTFEPVSEPLVNIRFTLKQAADAGVLAPEQASALIEAARAIYFPERCWDAVFASAPEVVGEEVAERVCHYVQTSRVDQKREDALAALRLIRAST